jgi:hypothetical protein
MALQEFPQSERRDALIERCYEKFDIERRTSSYETIEHTINYLSCVIGQKDEKLTETLCDLLDRNLIPDIHKIRAPQVQKIEQYCLSMQSTSRNPVAMKVLAAIEQMHKKNKAEDKFFNSRNYLKSYLSITQEI